LVDFRPPDADRLSGFSWSQQQSVQRTPPDTALVIMDGDPRVRL
jgi:hypothetical protein